MSGTVGDGGSVTVRVIRPGRRVGSRSLEGNCPPTIDRSGRIFRRSQKERERGPPL